MSKGFHQYNSILNRAGSDNGYVKVERVSGTAPFYAYGVINDNFNSDGSFVFPLTASSLMGSSGQTLPVVIETGAFQSELTVTNFSSSGRESFGASPGCWSQSARAWRWTARQPLHRSIAASI